MDSIDLIIAVFSGITIGTALGIYIAALFAGRKIQRAEQDAWRASSVFHRKAYHLTPRD